MYSQGLQGIAFFEATACLTLLVLFLHLKRDISSTFYKLWLCGWICLTTSSFAELALFYGLHPWLRLLAGAAYMAALVLFLASAVHYAARQNRFYWPVIWLCVVLSGTACYYDYRAQGVATRWQSSVLQSGICLAAGWLLLRTTRRSLQPGGKLLAGAFLLLGINALDRFDWTAGEPNLFRFAFDHFLNASLGIGMIVLLLESARARSEEISEKMRQFTMLTASSSQAVSLQELLQKVLQQITSSLGATHGMIRLMEGKPDAREFVARAWVGFDSNYLKQHERFALSEPWVQGVLVQKHVVSAFEDEKDPRTRRNMAEAGITQLVTIPLRGQEGPVGLLNIGTMPGKRFLEDEIQYLVNVANFLGTTVENVNLFEQVKTVQLQWAYTFDSIGDPILVHDPEGRIVRGNLRLADLLGRDAQAMVGRTVHDLFSAARANYQLCPYCEGISGEGDNPDPWLQGFFLTSNSTFSDPMGRKLGTIHVLKDITERKKAEEKYRTLVASVQEGVFIATVNGRFLDFNDALMRITGYSNRDELMQVDIPATLYVNPQDRERLRRLLGEHGSVNDFEFEIRCKDGEIRTVSESSTAVRDSQGNVTAYQGFVLDVTERHRAEQEIRRRNRELVVLNSLAEILVSSLDLSDSIHRTLRQILELFGLDAASLYLFEPDGLTLKRVASVGHRSEFARHFPEVRMPSDLLQQVRSVRAMFLSVAGLPLPPVAREVQRKEGIESAYILPLWSKDKIIGGLGVGCRTMREFSSADISLLIAVASQVANAVERSLLYEETRLAYDNLRKTQEQLLHSEKLAAVGQLISGVAHELNNPLTAILGYSQLLTSSGQVGPLALGYTEKIYKQAQRTHRIVQNLLSFARQHKPERMPVRLNAILEDTLALRDYDLRMGQIQVQLELSEDLPEIAADPHQLQQVFLNLINNALDAILEKGAEGELRVRTGEEDNKVFIEFSDTGPGVKDASRVFDPFYTTKPVGKGTGLGLSICYGIVTEHGGTIRVTNRETGGATFRIELPLRRQAAVPESVARNHGAGRASRILLIEEDANLRNRLMTLLRSSEFAVEAPASLADCAVKLAGKEFELVIADLDTVAGDPPTPLAQALARESLETNSRVIWMSGSAPDAREKHVHLTGQTAVLRKPFPESELLAEIEARLARVAAPISQ